MNKKILFSIILTSVILIGGGIWFVTKSQAPVYTGLDDFAKCLTEKKLVMYGAAWCSHCQNQKKLFGDSFQYVSYVECPDQPQICLDKEVNGYPTWITADGTKLEGEQKLTKLAEITGCSLPQ